MLTKELCLYERDETDKLIPQARPLIVNESDEKEYPTLKGQTIKVIPLTRGEIKRLFNVDAKVDTKVETDKDVDGELILKNCIEPKFAEKDIPYIKPVLVRSIVSTILNESGIKIDNAGTKRIDDSDEFGKNSSGLGGKEKKVA